MKAVRLLAFVSIAFVAACGEVIIASPPPAPAPASREASPQLDARTAAGNFAAVVDRVEPVAERTCRNQTQGIDCDFRIVVDRRANLPPNAFQTIDDNGRPVIGFTVALIADARNQDELAFILGHEAAHHIEGHLLRVRDSALAGAALAGILAELGGADARVIETAQNVGANVGARTFSKEFELEADRLGTVIAFRAGYDPLRGAEYFTRIPDPGNRFLGSHPPNNERIDIVRRTLARIR